MQVVPTTKVEPTSPELDVAESDGSESIVDARKQLTKFVTVWCASESER